MNLPEVLRLKYPDIKFSIDVILADEGDGPFIREWKRVEPVPTQADLDQWKIEFDLPYRQKQAAEARRYPSIQDQLDMQYKDKRDGTTTWYDAISAVKSAHPKPVK